MKENLVKPSEYFLVDAAFCFLLTVASQKSQFLIQFFPFLFSYDLLYISTVDDVQKRNEITGKQPAVETCNV